MLASIDIYCATHLGGEIGVILVEAIAVQDYDWPVVSAWILAVYERVVSRVGAEVVVTTER